MSVLHTPVVYVGQSVSRAQRVHQQSEGEYYFLNQRTAAQLRFRQGDKDEAKKELRASWKTRRRMTELGMEDPIYLIRGSRKKEL